MNIGLYFCTCGESYVSDFPYNTSRCLTCNSEIQITTEPTSKQLSTLVEPQLKQLWKQFENVAFDENDEITERFLIWLPSTNRFMIWLWFESCLKADFINLPGKLVWRSEGWIEEDKCECGRDIPIGQSCFYNRSYGKILCSDCGKRNMIDLWTAHGYMNPWIRTANDPFFSRSSFHVCESVEELIEKFQRGNWSLGQAFVYKNLAFINQVDGGDEWLAIKDYCPFESITFRAVLRRGEEHTYAYIQELLDYEIDREQGPDYSFVEALV